MLNILNIDTSSTQCSVCVSQDGEIIIGYESSEKMDHSASLAPYVEKCLHQLQQKGLKLNAVSVSNGPGSYTGLRIGLSLAKGLCFGEDLKLITLSTLEILAVRAMFSYPELTGEEIIVPMIDARRMEVYTAAYTCGLEQVMPPQAMILDENSFSQLWDYQKVIFIGDGIDKFKDLFKGNNAIWLTNETSHAKFMPTLSEKCYREQEFADVAYAVPFYLKEYQTTTPKNKI